MRCYGKNWDVEASSSSSFGSLRSEAGKMRSRRALDLECDSEEYAQILGLIGWIVWNFTHQNIANTQAQ